MSSVRPEPTAACSGHTKSIRLFFKFRSFRDQLSYNYKLSGVSIEETQFANLILR